MDKRHEIIIIGAGVVGTASMYALSRYSSFKDVLMLEKEKDVALFNSNSNNNSQTLHSGEIETNYSIAKTKETKENAQLVVKYAEKELKPEERPNVIQQCQKMALAVGDEEAEKLEKRYDSEFKDIFPYVKKIDKREDLEKVEENVVKGRRPDEKLLALFTEKGYMVDYHNLSKSFMDIATLREGYNSIFNTTVKNIEKTPDGYIVSTNDKKFLSESVLVTAGAYSLFFAKKLGYGENMGVLSVGGKFYYSKRVLKGKVYRVEREGIPFAAVHGDPDITNPDITRFGPTVNVSPELEKGNIKSVPDYIESLDIDLDTVESLEKIFFDETVSKIIRENFIYSIPGVGKISFTKNEVNKIVPSLKPEDLKLAKNVGGIRPQVIDTKNKRLALGGTAIEGDGALFSVTPSPGATSCLKEAMDNCLYLADYNEKDFDLEKFQTDFDYKTNK